MQPRKLALVLQGGGASGAWQAGVLAELLKIAEFTDAVASIIGTSVGGLNGALLAQTLAGQRESAQRIFSDVWLERASWRLLWPGQMCALIVEVADGPRVCGGNVYLIVTAAAMVGQSFLRVDEKFVVMDGLDNKGLYLFQFGPTHSEESHRLPLALRATSALPFVFPGVPYHGAFLRDGGLLANNPGDIVSRLGIRDFLVISPKRHAQCAPLVPTFRRMHHNLKARIDRLRQAGDHQNSVVVLEPQPGHSVPGTLNFGKHALRAGFEEGIKLARGFGPTFWPAFDGLARRQKDHFIAQKPGSR